MQKITAPSSTISRDLTELEKETGNLYEAISIVAKRANQISSQVKEELHNKLQEFASDSDSLEEIFENREQIEISTYYERQPKATLVATEEFLQGKVYYRNPAKDKNASK